MAITALMFGPHLYTRYYLPARVRGLLRSMVDPDAGRERVEALHADFEQPNLLWMLSTQTGHPRRGPALDATVWARLTLTRDREKIREIAFAGVVRAE